VTTFHHSSLTGAFPHCKLRKGIPRHKEGGEMLSRAFGISRKNVVVTADLKFSITPIWYFHGTIFIH
jgi:hypothetical protein